MTIVSASLTPVYLFIMLFHATWLVTMQDGPLWPYVAQTERTFCRANWWANLLYVNNIFTVSEPVSILFLNFMKIMCGLENLMYFKCLQHGWYMAADFQMFVIGVALQLLFWK